MTAFRALLAMWFVWQVWLTFVWYRSMGFILLKPIITIVTGMLLSYLVGRGL